MPVQRREPGPFPVVASTGVIDSHIASKVEPPGVVTGRSGSIGGVQYISEPFWPLNTTLYVKDFCGNDPQFVYYLLQHLPLQRYAGGSTIPSLDRKALSAIPIDLPPLKEQRRIADLLGALDLVIEQGRCLDRAVIKMRGRLLSDLFPRSAAVRGETTTALSEAASFINGRAFKPSEFTIHGLPVIRIAQFLDPAAQMDFFDGEGRQEHRIDSGDIVFSWSATLAVGEWRRGPAWLNQHLFKVVPREGIDAGWFRYALESRLPELNAKAHGSTMRHITRAELDTTTVVVPDVSEQERVARILAAVDAESDALRCLTDAYGRLRRSLLADLFGGHVVIPDSYDRFFSLAVQMP